jgi:hypothetical protein
MERDELNTQGVKFTESVHELPQAAGEAIVAVHNDGVDLPPAARAMSSPGESEEQAEADYNTFVSMNEDAATNDQVNFWLAGGTGYSDKALAEFAAALHAVVDSTSPTHRGFQVWNWKNPRMVAKHVYGERESVFSGSVVDEAIPAAQQAFNKTFHPYNYNEFDFLQLMNQQQHGKACVTTYGPNGPETTCQNY